MSITIEEINEESWFKIPNHDSLRPFFMSIVSDSNHWMFISSNGGLTAGRKNAEHALFPYYSDDKITELAHNTGPKTIFQVETDGGTQIWEPFSNLSSVEFNTTRNLYKNRHGNKVLFEEVNHDLDLTFWYEWCSSNSYGFVRNAAIINDADRKQSVNMLDGLQNILPYGVDSDLQKRQSNLVDAYKRSELAKESGLGIFALSAIIVDRAEPSEALKANTVWSLGLKNPKHLLSSFQLADFRKGKPVTEEADMKGEKGAYFISARVNLAPKGKQDWTMVANVNQSQADVIALNREIMTNKKLREEVWANVELGTENLKSIVGAADGLELTSDSLRDTRHFANVLFNVMRGGIFDHNYQIEKKDFSAYLEKANRALFAKHQSFVDGLDEVFDKSVLMQKLAAINDNDLLRLSEEYLPLRFSRRHGDPSRPWNKFSINTNSEIDGSKILDYEGNWRDIFQNWEALVQSYPDFIEGMISKFLNASTFDGYNPYRVTKDGFDWEISEPDDPWSYIGYWGDHQIIYLLKFLEFHRDYRPSGFNDLFAKNCFVYANVPYRIKPYSEIIKDPKDTIEFDEESDKAIRESVVELGADGALRSSRKDAIHRVNFIEKILATALAKVSNLIPEAGIWLNTQRPEWNDANNALVGNGVSMVTLYYLRRFLKFMDEALDDVKDERVDLSEEMSTMFTHILNVLKEYEDTLDEPMGDELRKTITEGLGKAASDFREKIYDHGFSGDKVGVKVSAVRYFVSVALKYMEHSIKANQREDKLYHAYNLMSMTETGISISYLDEMLEGQVAVLSSGSLSSKDALEVLNALRKSALYRKDQNSYILYPNKQLPGFLEKNNVAKYSIDKSKLLQRMIINRNSQIIVKDVDGGFHFNGNFRNSNDLKEGLQALSNTEYAPLAEAEESVILDIFEEVFNHKAFTGRSGTFFGYEGLGSIYWHMVSKLHLAVFEVCEQAHYEDGDKKTRDALAHHFDEIGLGIGLYKEPKLYGAFPTDPYSHTPWHRGAQQPGMTGQVKEDVLVRFGELGIAIGDGRLKFDPFLLKKTEFLADAESFEYSSLNQELTDVNLPAHSLGFTCCQVPVTYHLSGDAGLKIEMNDGSVLEMIGNELDSENSTAIFHRTGKVKSITVSIPEEQLR
ncbi:hypothetical protein O3Q51_05320 [Cryomorphaceae bacterium 1068]|nr:hypothetical protein [Cryomorphaceae bacterium 1068]